jgi:hypothetical protein
VPDAILDFEGVVSASRGKLHEDPVVFAAMDPFSYALGGLLLLTPFAAA